MKHPHFPHFLSANIIVFLVQAFLLADAPVIGKSPQTVEDLFLPDGNKAKAEVWIEGLEIPWSLIFLPDPSAPGARALVSERTGRIRLIQNGKLQEEPYAEISVHSAGEGGLMGLALHPKFPSQPYIYAMHTYQEKGKKYNRVIRLKDRGKSASLDKIILDKVHGARFHNGGRIGFGPDGMLYITTGEIFEAELAQDLKSMGGKILRVTADGDIPKDNPFPDSPVYSYGHRNPQGLAWHPETHDLFISEHGPSGEYGTSANDEVNVVAKGGNYGWPRVIGAPGLKSYRDPLVAWKKATPPAGMTFYKGDLFLATLRSEALIRIQLEKTKTTYRVKAIERWFAEGWSKGKYGRLRDVTVGPDNKLYFLTSNRDGRGRVRTGDDKIYRITFE